MKAPLFFSNDMGNLETLSAPPAAKCGTVKFLNSTKSNISNKDPPKGWHRACSIDKYPPMAARPSPPTWSPLFFLHKTPVP